MCLLAYSEATLDLRRGQFILAHDNVSQICYCGQILLENFEVNYSFCDNLTPLGVTVFLLEMVHGQLLISLKINVFQRVTLPIPLWIIVCNIYI